MTDPGKFHFDYDYSETVTLADGTRVKLRLLRSRDRDLLKEGFEHLSEESRYLRFLSPKQKLSTREVDYLVDIDQVDHVAIGAVRQMPDQREKGIGVARFIRLKDEPDTAEAAVTVVDEFQGEGLGRALLKRLVDAALERDINFFRAMIFSENEPIQQLLREAGPIEIIGRDGAVVTVDVDLRQDREFEEDVSDERGPLRTVLSMAARGLVSLVRRVSEEMGVNGNSHL